MKHLIAFFLIVFLAVLSYTVHAQQTPAYAGVTGNNTAKPISDATSGAPDGNTIPIATAAPLQTVNAGNPATVAAGSGIMVIDNTRHGLWSSSNDRVATVNENGLVTALRRGNVEIIHVTSGDDGDATIVTLLEVTGPAPASEPKGTLFNKVKAMIKSEK